MTGSSRVSNNAIRAPYAAPQSQASSSPTNGQSGGGVFGAPSVSRAAAEPNGSAVLVAAPYVPPAFRVSANVSNASNVQSAVATESGASRFVTPVPAAEQFANRFAEHFTDTAPHQTPAVGLPAVVFGNDEAPAPDFAQFVETGREEIVPSQELPWIDAFAVDAPEMDADESWPMGEAGKRLDELTQSLSSIDASRERQAAELRAVPSHDVSSLPSRLAATTPVANPALPMWSEEEWIDIMPTPHAEVSSDASAQDVQDAGPHVPFEALPSHAHAGVSVHAESAALALEGLAQRVRAGEVAIPVLPRHVAEETLLAGILSSMLGWPQQ